MAGSRALMILRKWCAVWRKCAVWQRAGPRPAEPCPRYVARVSLSHFECSPPCWGVPFVQRVDLRAGGDVEERQGRVPGLGGCAWLLLGYCAAAGRGAACAAAAAPAAAATAAGAELRCLGAAGSSLAGGGSYSEPAVQRPLRAKSWAKGSSLAFTPSASCAGLGQPAAGWRPAWRPAPRAAVAGACGRACCCTSAAFQLRLDPGALPRPAGPADQGQRGGAAAVGAGELHAQDERPEAGARAGGCGVCF